MAFDATFSRPLICIRAAWRGNAGWVAAVLGLAVGFVLYWIVGTVLMNGQAVAVEFHQTQVHIVPPSAIRRDLYIQVDAPPARNCTRTSQNLMYRDIDGQRFYYPLSSAMNGRGFPGSRYNFWLVVSLPSSMPDGDYQFIQRSSYVCSWFGGFINRRLTYQSDPEQIHIGAVP